MPDFPPVTRHSCDQKKPLSFKTVFMADVKYKEVDCTNKVNMVNETFICGADEAQKAAKCVPESALASVCPSRLINFKGL